MPGKVNPVMPEVVLQVAAQVIGNDTAITVGGMQGQFELNVRIPLIARNLLQSIALLASASELFAEKCVDGIEANRAGCEASAEGTLAVATALNPFIGYDKAAEIVKDASASGRTLREVAREHGVDEATLDAALDLRKIAAGRRRAPDERSRGEAGGEAAAETRDADLLERIEEHFDAAPRAAADVEEHGALTLFVSRIPWRFYGRPRLGLGEDVGADDVAAVRARQRELGVREAFEWVHETTPSLAGAAAAAGLEVLQVPLLALVADDEWAPPPAPAGRGTAHARRRRRRAARCAGGRRAGVRCGGAWRLGEVGPEARDLAVARLGGLELPARADPRRAHRDGRRGERAGRPAGRGLAPTRRRRVRGDGHRHAARRRAGGASAPR